ncbi:MAG: 50S ribosomal protein L17 [Chloroflexi bacterium]|jgi:large subunit ribosomal protein L17|nr:50S ribosomal protein L17 [Anaerolineaceae bacterium]NMB87825.1 50S ribosomal protein L17 [Chloroflexota bacterium]
MRHLVAGYKLGRSRDQRKSLRKTMICQLFDHERIRTTQAKAAFIRGEAEELITLARNSGKGSDTDKVNARRYAAARLRDPKMVKKLFDDIAPRYENRKGGYTRVYQLGPRLGDAAKMVVLELIED